MGAQFDDTPIAAGRPSGRCPIFVGPDQETSWLDFASARRGVAGALAPFECGENQAQEVIDRTPESAGD